MAQDQERRSWAAPKAREPERQEQPERARKRPSTGSVVRGCVTGLLLAATVVVIGFAGGAQDAKDAAVSEGLTGLSEAKDRIVRADKLKAELPDAKEAARLFSRMASDVETIASVQNLYVQEAGALSLDGIPVDRQEPNGDIVAYTQEERTAMAQDRRDQKLADLDRSLKTFFDRSSVDDDGVNAAADWTGLVEGLSAREDVGSSVWTASLPSSFDDERRAHVVWTVTSAGGDVLGWATAEYRVSDGRFSDLRVMSAIASEED